MKRQVPLFIIGNVVFFSLLLSFLFYKATRPLGHRPGDIGSDMVTMTAGDHFNSYGFLRSYFLPIFKFVNGKPVFYTHYPPGPYLVNGMFKRLGITGLFALRLFPIAVMLGAVYLFYRTVFLYTGNRGLALICGYYVLLTNYFLMFTDSLSHLTYFEFLRFAIVYWFILYCKTPPKDAFTRRNYFIAVNLLLFLQIIISYEYVIFSYMLLFGFGAIIARQKIRTLVVFLVPTVIGFALHLIQNAMAVGGIRTAIADLYHAVLYRTLNRTSETVAANIYDIEEPVKFSVASFFRNVSGGININFGLSATDLATMILFLAAVVIVRRKTVRPFAFPLALLAAASCSWWIVFPQHTYMHYYLVARHAMPAIAVLVGCFVYEYASFVRSAPHRLTHVFTYAGLAILIDIIRNNYLNFREMLSLLMSP